MSAVASAAELVALVRILWWSFMSIALVFSVTSFFTNDPKLQKGFATAGLIVSVATLVMLCALMSVLVQV